MANQNIETSKKGYAAFDKGDVETVLNDYDDSVEFVIPGTNAVSGTYRGKDGVKELFGKIAEQNFKITPSRFLADGDVVVVLFPELGQTSAHRRGRSWPARRGGRRVAGRRRSGFGGRL